VTPRFRLIALVAAAALVAAGCGQKSGVAGTQTSADGSGVGGAPADDAPPAAHEPGPDDTAGVTDDEIVIGVHAPVTGASPLRQDTFDIGKDIYWDFLAESEPDALGGRRVRVAFRDDEFNPNRAVQVCRELVEQEGAFLLVGGGGADQITACAEYADGVGVPYFSAGVNESGLADLSTYFALSLTYAQQAPLIVARLQELELERIAVLVADTPSFQDGHDAFVEAAEEAELDIVADDPIVKDAGQAEALAAVQSLQNVDAEAVFILTSPTVYLAVAAAARGQGYDPVFIGPGITSGLNVVTNVGCNDDNVANGQFFSPFPELDVIGDLDPDYLTAYEQFGGGGPADDIGIALWGLNKSIRLMLEATGDELGRAALMNTIEAGEEFETGVYPPVSYAPGEPFGGTGAHLLVANCDARQYDTAETFVEISEGE